MKKIISPITLSTLLLSSFLLVPSHKEAKVAKAADYYASITSSMQGQTLKVALYNIIKGHTKRSYDNLENDMKITDRDYKLSPAGTDEEDPYMYLLYADYNGNTSTAKRWGTSLGGFNTDGEDVWNKEHIWAKSNGFDSKSLPAYSDLHHLRASDWKCNNIRSNNPFAVVATHSSSTAVDDWTQNRKTDNYSSGGLFEPRDSDKGDVARALFYMATRYYNGDGSNSSLSLTTGTDGSGGKWGYLDTLLAWHVADPVDEFEAHRNDLVYDIQKNRNPYIDHPEYARAVFKDEPIVQPDTLINLTYSGSPSKTTYKAGESFNSNGLTVTATYRKNDNTTYTENVTSKVSWTPSPLTGSTTKVTGTYSHGGVDKTITISGITVVSLSSIALSGYPIKSVYEEGDVFNHTGLTLTAYFTDSSSEDVTSIATWPVEPLTKGQMSITVTYGGLQKTYTGIHVKEKALSSNRIKFKDYGSDGSTVITAATITNDLVSGSDIATISAASTIYQGSTGLKFASGKQAGSLTITLKSATVVTKLEINAKQYNSKDGTTVTVNTSASVGGSFTPTSSFETHSIDIDKLITTITISSSSGKRFYLSYVDIYSGSGGGESDDAITQWGIDYLFTNETTFDGQGTGLCRTGNYYHSAKVALLSLESKTSGTINKLQTNSKYQSEYNRYMAWARANYDDAPFEDDYSFLSINIEKIGYFAEENSSFTIIIVIIAALSVVTISTLIILKKKRK